MVRLGVGADKTCNDNIDWDGFGIGSNVAHVDIRDGKILRVRRLDYGSEYDIESLRPYKLEKNGKVFKEPTKSPLPPFSIAYKRHAFSQNRIPYPMIREHFDPEGDRHTELRGTDKYRRISWDEATEIIAKEMHRQYEVYGPGSILLQQDGHGETKIVHPCHGCMTKLCDELGGLVMQARQPDSWEGWYWGGKHIWGMEPLGQGKTQNLAYDITNNSELLLYWGCDNETTTWGWGGQIPSMLSFWFRDIGIQSIFICPDLNYSAAVHADKWIPIYPNTDLALQFAIAYVWMTEGLFDREYIDTHTIGYDWLEYEVMGGEDGVPKTPKWAEERCGVPSRIIKALAREWHDRATTICHCNGGSFIRSCYSHEPARMEVSLLAMQGLGKPGRNYMKFIEWNIYECPDFNPMPRDEQYLTGFGGYNASMLEIVDQRFIPKTLIPEGILATPDKPIDWYGHVVCMLPVEDQFDHFQFPQPGDPALHMIWSDAPCWSTCWNCGNKYLEALRSPSMEFILVQHPWFENDTHFADVILPVSTRFEVDDIGYDSSSGAFNTIVKCDQCVEPFGESKSDWICVQEVAKKLEQMYGGTEERYANLLERYTGGRTVESSVEMTYHTSRAEEYVSWDDFKEKGYACIPHAENWEADHAGFYDFYIDPENNPLSTPSGKIEFYSSALAENFPDDKERRPYPHYIAATDRFHEYREDPKAEEYPYLLVSNHPRWRIHANFDDNSIFREIETCKVIGPDGYAYEPVWVHPSDAESIGVKTGDVVKVRNDRGWVLGGVYVTERIMPEVVLQDHGARLDSIVPGESDRGGANNLIAPKETTSANCAGEVTSGYLVNIEKVDVFEMAKQYPEAFSRTFDAKEGVDIENWLIEEA